MKKDEIKIGTIYRVKVSGTVQDVRITGENPHGGWDGVNIATNRPVRIKSAPAHSGGPLSDVFCTHEGPHVCTPEANSVCQQRF
jgi:hypothetical protein